MKKFATLAFAAAALAVIGSTNAFATHESVPSGATTVVAAYNGETVNSVGETASTTPVQISVAYPDFAAIKNVTVANAPIAVSETNYTQDKVQYDNVVTADIRTNSADGLTVTAAITDLGTTVGSQIANNGDVKGRLKLGAGSTATYGVSGAQAVQSGFGVWGFNGGTISQSTTAPTLLDDAYQTLAVDIEYSELDKYAGQTFQQQVSFTVIPNN